ncbi:hypothetical protein GN956_G1574 [Arapaima gigas]
MGYCYGGEPPLTEARQGQSSPRAGAPLEPKEAGSATATRAFFCVKGASAVTAFGMWTGGSSRSARAAASMLLLMLLMLLMLSLGTAEAVQESGTVIPAESRPCVDCHAFEFMQRALQDLKKTAFNLDSRTESLVLRAERRALCDCVAPNTLS